MLTLEADHVGIENSTIWSVGSLGRTRIGAHDIPPIAVDPSRSRQAARCRQGKPERCRRAGVQGHRRSVISLAFCGTSRAPAGGAERRLRAA
jgi:hypothetical protein